MMYSKADTVDTSFVRLIITLVVIFLGFIYLVQYNWKRRWLYYYASKIPGAFSLPLIGSAHLLLIGPRDYYKKMTHIVARYPNVFKAWLGPDLYIVTSQPQDIEIILTTCMKKPKPYEFVKEYLGNALIAAPVDKWKRNRKIINPTFNAKVLNSFHDIFAKYAKKIADELHEVNNGNVMLTFWQNTLDSTLETLVDVDPLQLEDRYEVIRYATRAEKLITERFYKFWLHPDFFWRLSASGKEAKAATEKTDVFVDGLIQRMKNPDLDAFYEHDVEGKRFFNYLLEKEKNKELTYQDLKEELMLMLVASSETTAAALCYTVFQLGLNLEIQEKMYEELLCVLGDIDRDITLEDANQMSYLERVIKETQRLIVTIPLVMRAVEKDLHLDSYVIPAGSSVIVPIGHVHTRPDLWPDPLKFDPDRFLPEEVKKRHPCAYIPFSYGTRNCIGYKYAMLSMKVTIAEIVRRYTIKAVNYNSVGDIELKYHIITEPKDGYKVMFERRRE